MKFKGITVKIEKETVEQEVYIASDGKEFRGEYARTHCLNYEEEYKELKKQEAISHLKFEPDCEWASMVNPFGDNYEYHWYKVSNEEELKLFCDAYSAYNSDLKNIELVEVFIKYPDYICLVDYPQGRYTPEWFTLSSLMTKTRAFLKQFSPCERHLFPFHIGQHLFNIFIDEIDELIVKSIEIDESGTTVFMQEAALTDHGIMDSTGYDLSDVESMYTTLEEAQQALKEIN